ncbi:Smr/MutS family protein [Sedimentitalea todarodis]|uniref:Smr/MutS family protein n=1 Tax=Sedimentitalea todarodis TaxID=1631240 RepID=A0ABU3VIP1_9RHOB|nr:Smr/MutS family protein [Sedimentitalea todarodis]MDU9006046.1 Smr/MutS family protein [Sedimentitalea todarodis]
MVRRKLTDEEIDLWHRVVERAERLHVDGNPTRPLPKPKPTRYPTPLAPRPNQATPPSPTLTVRPQSVQMDRKAYGRMKRGKLVPEGRIDLHGMTLERAHPALTRFILSSQASGRRLVLVITGKGKESKDTGPIPVPRGILRRNVPHWLSIPPLAQAVLHVENAHISHGGEGAYYVYLRKFR